MEDSIPRSTGKAARDAQENTIDNLNARWDFGIPRSKQAGLDDEDVAPPSRQAKECFGLIHFLSFRTSDLEIAIQDFENNAKQNIPGWQSKGNQAPGTLPAQPESEAQLQKREVVVRQNLCSRDRKTLLTALVTRLKTKVEEVKEREKVVRVRDGPSAEPRAADLLRQTPPRTTSPDHTNPRGLRSPKRKINDIPEVGLPCFYPPTNLHLIGTHRSAIPRPRSKSAHHRLPRICNIPSQHYLV